jgi:hypothetical protein
MLVPFQLCYLGWSEIWVSDCVLVNELQLVIIFTKCMEIQINCVFDFVRLLLRRNVGFNRVRLSMLSLFSQWKFLLKIITTGFFLAKLSVKLCISFTILSIFVTCDLGQVKHDIIQERVDQENSNSSIIVHIVQFYAIMQRSNWGLCMIA